MNIDRGIKFYWQVSLALDRRGHVVLPNRRRNIKTLEMADSSRSSKSNRIQDSFPSVRPSYVSIISIFVCGILWLKNEATNKRLSVLETTLPHMIREVNGFSKEYYQGKAFKSMGDSRVVFARKAQQNFSKRLHYPLGKCVCLCDKRPLYIIVV